MRRLSRFMGLGISLMMREAVGKNRKQIIATLYPDIKANNARRLAGKYSDYVPDNLRGIDYESAREAAMLAAFREKHDSANRY